MPLAYFPVRAQVAVSDIERAARFYEHFLGLPRLKSTPSADIENGGRIYRSGDESTLIVYQTDAASSGATVAVWFVDDIDQVVTELTGNCVRFLRYDGLEHAPNGTTDRAGGGRIAWFQDPDGNTFAIESASDADDSEVR